MRHSAGEMSSRATPTAFQRPSTVRRPIFRSLFLIEDRFDGIQIGAIGRQEAPLSAGAFNGLADAGDLVGGQIVHHDEVSGGQRRDQDLLDIGTKLLAVDRAIEHAWRSEAVMTQRGDKGRGLPVAKRSVRDQALAFLTPAVPGRHVGRGPGLVDEHQPARIERLLVFSPGGAGFGDVGPQLLGGAQSFF